MCSVRAAYSDEWCMKHNHHCDPELFDNHLRSEVVVSDVTNALAFVVAFDNTVYWSEQERWRLEGFRGLRKYLRENPVGTSLPDDLFMNLDEDLAKISRQKVQEHIVGLFEKDQEIHDLLKAALAANRHAGQPWRKFFVELDPRWERVEIWKRLAQAIESPPEFTEVVYIYRHINTPQPIEYKEVLRTDLTARFGDIPTQRLLDPETLEKVFAP